MSLGQDARSLPRRNAKLTLRPAGFHPWPLHSSFNKAVRGVPSKHKSSCATSALTRPQLLILLKLEGFQALHDRAPESPRPASPSLPCSSCATVLHFLLFLRVVRHTPTAWNIPHSSSLTSFKCLFKCLFLSEPPATLFDIPPLAH